jgi:hypothetical protein
MKTLFLMLVIAIGFTSCTKDKSLNNDTVQQSDQRLNIFSDVAAQGLKLGVSVTGSYRYKTLAVKVIHYDYYNGHMPLVPVDSTSYEITGYINSAWSDLHTTTIPYSGMMRVSVSEADSSNKYRYIRDVQLTDTAGYIVNKDTASVLSATIGVCKINNVVPKSFK